MCRWATTFGGDIAVTMQFSSAHDSYGSKMLSHGVVIWCSSDSTIARMSIAALPCLVSH
jgi:hypothetical protein